MGADWEMAEMCGVGYEMSQKGGRNIGRVGENHLESYGRVISTPLHTSHT